MCPHVLCVFWLWGGLKVTENTCAEEGLSVYLLTVGVNSYGCVCESECVLMVVLPCILSTGEETSYVFLYKC